MFDVMPCRHVGMVHVEVMGVLGIDRNWSAEVSSSDTLAQKAWGVMTPT